MENIRYQNLTYGIIEVAIIYLDKLTSENNYNKIKCFYGMYQNSNDIPF